MQHSLALLSSTGVLLAHPWPHPGPVLAGQHYPTVVGGLHGDIDKYVGAWHNPPCPESSCASCRSHAMHLITHEQEQVTVTQLHMTVPISH